ncbi:MAG: glycosyltransferase [Acetatifactor sp.]
MKLLIVSMNYEDPSSMFVNYYHSLAEIAEVDFYGPGFSTEAELEQGILDYAEKEGPFEAVILIFSLLYSSLDLSSIRDIYQFHRCKLSDYSVNQVVRYADRIVDDIKKLDTVQMVLFDQDIINIRNEWYNCLADLLDGGFYILSPGIEFLPTFVEREGRSFGDGLMLNNRFRNLLEKYPQRSISIGTIASIPGEYYWGPLENRKYDWVVPGNIDGCYPNRGKILRMLEAKGYKVFQGFIDRTMAYRVDSSRIERCEYQQGIVRQVDERLGKPSPYLQAAMRRESIAAWRENYKVSLRKSKIAYADGGDGHVVVRKYIEIPANGTLLAGDNVMGLERWGFRNWENMVIVTPENVLDITEELLKNPEKMQDIANKGRQLVLSVHTTRKRAEDTIRAIESIRNGKYQGSYWEDGKFIITERK